MARQRRGADAKAECQRSGIIMRRADMVVDGQTGLLVHPGWWEPKHPQETLADVSESMPGFTPAPELSIPEGHGDAAPGYLIDNEPPTLTLVSPSASGLEATGTGVGQGTVEIEIIF